MKKNIFPFVVFFLCLLLTACDNIDSPEICPPDVEPTAVYDWMAGESPVPNRRIGLRRYGACLSENAASSKGVYFLNSDNGVDTYILYADHGSDELIKLCGRADCTHDNADCNAYLYCGNSLGYYSGYLYAVSGKDGEHGDGTQDCGLIRMDPDGANHKMVLDLWDFVESVGGTSVFDAMITDGVLFFSSGYYEKEYIDDNKNEVYFTPVCLENYYYKLDGSMETPQKMIDSTVLYNCGDTVLLSTKEAQQGGEYGSRWAWDADTNTQTYLTDNRGVPGYFDEEEAYYFRDGGIWRMAYADEQEQLMAETGLEGEYMLEVYPDCMVLVSQEWGEDIDRNLYFYNWAYELVDTVAIDYPCNGRTNYMLVTETAERFILTDEYQGYPKYYINKSELGTGNVEIHAFQQN